jgi:hypothetical protein
VSLEYDLEQELRRNPSQYPVIQATPRPGPQPGGSLVYQELQLQVEFSVRQTMAEVGLAVGNSREAAGVFALSNKTLRFPTADGN